MKSFQSLGSNNSGKSEADRLIEAISEPLNVNHERPSIKNKKSRSDSAKGHSYNNHASSAMSERGVQRPSTPPGRVSMRDQRTPLKAIKVPDDNGEMLSREASPLEPVKRLEELSDISTTDTEEVRRVAKDRSPKQESKEGSPKSDKPNADNMSVLVAEDDPINSRIIHKRLEKAGHACHLTVNGEECASIYGEKPGFFDVVLMDMQVSLSHMLPQYSSTH